MQDRGNKNAAVKQFIIFRLLFFVNKNKDRFWLSLSIKQNFGLSVPWCWCHLINVLCSSRRKWSLTNVLLSHVLSTLKIPLTLTIYITFYIQRHHTWYYWLTDWQNIRHEVSKQVISICDAPHYVTSCFCLNETLIRILSMRYSHSDFSSGGLGVSPHCNNVPQCNLSWLS